MGTSPHGQAFRDLERAISDCASVACIAAQLAQLMSQMDSGEHPDAIFAVFPRQRNAARAEEDLLAAWEPPQ